MASPLTCPAFLPTTRFQMIDSLDEHWNTACDEIVTTLLDVTTDLTARKLADINNSKSQLMIENADIFLKKKTAKEI